MWNFINNSASIKTLQYKFILSKFLDFNELINLASGPKIINLHNTPTFPTST